MTPEAKQQTIKDFQLHAGDSGSPVVQVAILTRRITELSDHLKSHSKDHSSRRGLLKLVGQRTGLLKYLSRSNHEQYQGLIQKLGIRK